MSLERLVEEIRARAERELQEESDRAAAQERTIAEDRDRRIAQLKSDGQRQTELDAQRERAQKLANAKLTARKVAYEAREKQTTDRLNQVRATLSAYADSDEYPQVLKRMYALAVDRLGKQVKVSGRAADASLLKSVAGKTFDDKPAPILGGLIAQTTDGSRRLNLSFDELLRLREDQVRSLLAA
jgi:vacuolar-type H+-ATPase subunit E/Vma4